MIPTAVTAMAIKASAEKPLEGLWPNTSLARSRAYFRDAGLSPGERFWLNVLGGIDMDEFHPVRRRAVDLLRAYTGSGSPLDALKGSLCDGGWDGESHPSGDFAHWMLWRMGCVDSRILSRNVPEVRIQRTGHPVQRLCAGAQRLGAWKPFRLDDVPKPGDIVLSGSRARGEQERARIFIAAEGPRLWRMACAWTRGTDLRVTEDLVELRGEELVRHGGRELLVGWVDLLRVLGDLAGPSGQ